eukprot:TRINITY_DN20935_c0_g1_i1.p1 TRINITY_DN20935_c0_g1~~TRINITY_DN20935_c0_g1_i1.p1  ORF type:complete len:213 (+),score=23.54 TRINITY_DN20935_c0_g1_i1:147-785(+)
MATASSRPPSINPTMQHSQMQPVSPFPPQPPPMPPQGDSQVVCSGCRTLLVYPNSAANVRCALCNVITQVPSSGSEMAQLICHGCRTLLMYIRGATSVQCSCCHAVNLAMSAQQVAHINCGGCGMTLMYPSGAPSVKCAVCQYVTQVMVSAHRMQMAPPPSSLPMQGPPMMPMPSSSGSRSQAVIVKNPMTLDDSGKLVNNTALGVITDKNS